MKPYSIAASALAAALLASCSGHGAQPSGLPATLSSSHTGSPSAVAVSTAPAGWAATATQGASVANAIDLGTLDASKVLTVRVGLQLHNVAQLQNAIASGQTVSPAQFMAQYAPTAAEVSAVTAYLQNQGLTHVEAAPDNLLVSADGTVAQVQTAFNTSLHAFSGSVFANVTPAVVPQSLGGIVVAVLGLNNAAKAAVHPAFAPTDCFPVNPAPAGTPCVRDFDARGIQSFYDAGSTPSASNTTVGVIAEGDVSQTVSDLRAAEVAQGLPQVPVTVMRVGVPSPDTAGVDEWDLDTQSSTGIAGTVKGLYIYATTSLSDSDIANAYSHWVTDNAAKLGNSSFGECEYQAWLDGAMRVDDQLFMQAAAQGQTMFASSGDTGSSCALAPTNGAPASGPPLIAYPAASPYVVSVGGTTLTANNDFTYGGEVSWNAGGGGLSQFENSTTWEQQGQIVGGTVAEANLRGVPDIAMAADPNAGGYIVYVAGAPVGIGGTSEASPLSMGVFARLASARNNAVGFAAPVLYKNYLAHIDLLNPNPAGTPPTQAVGGFHDILAGANGAYTAAPGYDYTTGLGTFDISVMNAQL